MGLNFWFKTKFKKQRRGRKYHTYFSPVIFKLVNWFRFNKCNLLNSEQKRFDLALWLQIDKNNLVIDWCVVDKSINQRTHSSEDTFQMAYS